MMRDNAYFLYVFTFAFLSVYASAQNVVTCQSAIGNKDKAESAPSVNLAEMIGKDVSLDGKLWSRNGHWWFDYNGEKLYLTSVAGPQLAFESDKHGCKATVSGRLVRQLRPDLGQISMKSDRDLISTYVIRNGEVEHDKSPRSWRDRFGPAYKNKNTLHDGVLELFAEESFRKNIIGNETKAMLYTERNLDAIEEILRANTPAVCDVLARRMDDSMLDDILRLIYAAILARVNDERGQVFLRNLAVTPGELSISEIFYCLGVFPYLASDVGEVKTDIAWAEETLITIMADSNKSKVAVAFSTIPLVLAAINSKLTREVLLDYILKNPGSPEGFYGMPSVTRVLCQPHVRLPAKDLLRLEAVTEDQSARRMILRGLLRLKHPAVAEEFIKDIEDGFVYMDIRDSSSPEVLDALRRKLPSLIGEAKSNVQMLLILGEKDPVPKIVTLLNDPKFSDKVLAMFELRRLGDRRAVTPVVKVLRQAPKDYFGDPANTSVASGIEHALAAIANTQSRKAIQELIDLLHVDLGRFGDYINGEGWRRITAAHLIEMTGESFGVDQAGWQAWEKEQLDERFQAIDPVQNSGGFRTGPEKRVDLGR